MDTKQPVWGSKRSNLVELRAEIELSSGRPSRSRLKIHRKLFVLGALTDSASCGGEDGRGRNESVVKSERIAVIVKDRVTEFQGIISSSPPVVFVVTLCHCLFHYQFFFIEIEKSIVETLLLNAFLEYSISRTNGRINSSMGTGYRILCA